MIIAVFNSCNGKFDNYILNYEIRIDFNFIISPKSKLFTPTWNSLFKIKRSSQ